MKKPEDRAMALPLTVGVEEILPIDIADICPWCGRQPVLFPDDGGNGPRSRKVACVHEDCPAKPSVSGNQRQQAIDAWNARKE